MVLMPGAFEFAWLSSRVVVAVDDDERLTPEALVRRLAPKSSHLLAAVVLRSNGPQTCQAAVCDQGHIGAIDVLRIIGPGMLRLMRGDQPPVEFAADRDKRWSRTVGVLGVNRFSRLRNSSATIVGAGRLGSQVAFQLAALGVSSLRLIDGDVLLMENLDAMPGLRPADVGQSKVAALAERLCEFQPDLAVTYLDKPVTDQAAESLVERRADVLITCVDNDTARLAVSLAAHRALMIHLDVATSIQHAPAGLQITADVRLLLPGEGCVACVGGLDDPERRLYDVAAPPNVLQRGHPVSWHEQRAGSLITINSIAAGAAVQTYLDLFTGALTSSCWRRIAWQPGAGIESAGGPVSASPDCRFCQP